MSGMHQGSVQAFLYGRDLDFPFGLEFSEKLSGLLPGRGIENGTHPVGSALYEFLRRLGRNVAGKVNLAALRFGSGELLAENLLQAWKAVHDAHGDLCAV